MKKAVVALVALVGMLATTASSCDQEKPGVKYPYVLDKATYRSGVGGKGPQVWTYTCATAPGKIKDHALKSQAAYDKIHVGDTC